MVAEMKNRQNGIIFWAIVLLFTLASCINQSPTAVNPAPNDSDAVATMVARTLGAFSPTGPAGPTATPTLPSTNTPGSTEQVVKTDLPAVTATAVNATSLPTNTPPAPNATATPLPTLTPPAPTGTAAPTLNPQPTTAAVQTCIDKAAYVADVTIPDNMLLKENTNFTKTWRIKNVGTCSWTDGYQLVFARGQILSGPPSSPLPKANPGDLIDVSVNLQTPADGGTYAGDWQFQNPAGKRFGVNSHGEDFIYLIIKVDWGPGVGPTPAPPAVNCAYKRNLDFEARLLQLINQERATKRLAPLTLNPQLNAAALAHSADMACNNFLDHTGSDKSTYSKRIRSQGYSSLVDSENIYAGGDAQVAFDWWKSSPIHYDNMMSNQVTQIGIAYAFFDGSKYGDYYTLDFARPR
jgi:uncharacterized protein YkwD